MSKGHSQSSSRSGRSGGSSRGRGFTVPGGAAPTTGRGYARTARVNESLREVIAEALEEIDDERLDMVTITGIDADPDFRAATVYYSALTAGQRSETAAAEIAEAFDEYRVRLQATIGREVRLRRTPLLSFLPDPAISEGAKIDDIIRHLPPKPPETPDE